MRSFGAPDALRITAGTPDEIAFLGEALAALDAARRRGADEVRVTSSWRFVGIRGCEARITA